MAAEPTKDTLPKGWARLGLQVPADVAREFRAAGAVEGPGGVKRLGTGAALVMLGMPDHVREAVLAYVALATARNPRGASPAEAWRVAELAMAHGATDEGVGWIIDRIMDPEVTPPAGRKASERPAGKKRRSG